MTNSVRDSLEFRHGAFLLSFEIIGLKEERLESEGSFGHGF
jgi:hypothetical protein